MLEKKLIALWLSFIEIYFKLILIDLKRIVRKEICERIETRIHIRLVRKQTVNHLGKLAK